MRKRWRAPSGTRVCIKIQLVYARRSTVTHKAPRPERSLKENLRYEKRSRCTIRRKQLLPPRSFVNGKASKGSRVNKSCKRNDAMTVTWFRRVRDNTSPLCTSIRISAECSSDSRARFTLQWRFFPNCHPGISELADCESEDSAAKFGQVTLASLFVRIDLYLVFREAPQELYRVLGTFRMYLHDIRGISR